MRLKGKFEVTEYTNTSGTISYRVTGTKLNGERVRINFSDEREALRKKHDLEDEAADIPVVMLSKRTRLSEADLAVAEATCATAIEKGWSFADVCKFGLQYYQDPLKPTLLKDAYSKFIEYCRGKNLRPLSIKNLESRLGHLVKAFPDSKVSEIQPDQIKGIIAAPGQRGKELVPKGATAQNNERRACATFFRWATRQKYCLTNPMLAIDPIKVDPEDPQILTLAEVRSIIHTAANYKGGIMIPYFVCGTFCGVRPAELGRINWDDFNLTEKVLIIGSKYAKMRAKRRVDLADNVVEWLLPYATKRIPFKGKNWRRDFDKVKRIAGFGTQKKLCCEATIEAGLKCKKKCCRQSAGKGHVCQKCHSPERMRKLKPWEPDILRHTAISYHYAKHENEGKTAKWAGNSPEMIHRHYKGLVSSKDADEFWNIYPDSNKVMQLLPAVND